MSDADGTSGTRGLDALRARVHGDPALACELRAIASDDFAAELMRIAATLGYQVAHAAIEGALDDARRRWLMRWLDGDDPAPSDVLDAATLRGWTPIRVRVGGREPSVDWAILEGPPREPFFEQTADRTMRHPFNALFARRTPIDALERLAELDPGIAPAGFIFHLSRCGSTLVAQMLAALPSTVVIAEAQPLDALLSLRRAGVAEERIVRWLRALVNVLASPRGGARHAFVKFHAWHALELRLVRRAFPTVPHVFLFREPRAVLRSQAAATGAELVEGTIDPRYLALGEGDAVGVPQVEYGVRVLAAIGAAAVRDAERGRTMFVDYHTLPDAVFTMLHDHFGVALTARDEEGLRAVAALDAKRGGAFTARDAARAANEIEHLATRWLDPIYAELTELAGATR